MTIRITITIIAAALQDILGCAKVPSYYFSFFWFVTINKKRLLFRDSFSLLLSVRTVGASVIASTPPRFAVPRNCEQGQQKHYEKSDG
jgi:hypothetical protein